MKVYRAAMFASVCVPVILCGNQAWAQTSEPVAARATPADSQDIIVTARKRQESILNVPVVETAIPKEQLQRLQTVDVKDLATLVPGLTIGHAQVAVGTLVAIRGIGTISSDPGVDASVSLNIDGLSLANGIAFNSGLFDLQQVEVLKGPQALFYGKSSPGGVISLRTADPTDRFEIIANASYEFEARTPREEVIVSGPVTDELKLRLAAMYQTSDGYFHNTAVAAPGTGAVTPTNRRDPSSTDYVIRGTALWTPSPEFSARLKINFVKDDVINSSTSQTADCPNGPNFAPLGIPFIVGSGCTLDRQLAVVYLDKSVFKTANFDGVPRTDQIQSYGSLELNYDPVSRVTLTSTTAYYRLLQSSFFNATNSSSAGPAIGLSGEFGRRAFTEEVRATSDFTSSFNFTLGALYENGSFFNMPSLLGNTTYKLPAVLFTIREAVGVRTYSGFGQLRWKFLPGLELAAGGRFTDETRHETANNFTTGVNVPVPLGVDRIHSANFAPEVTLTYKPAELITLFASYKRAFKSGSFSFGGAPSPGEDDSFGDERVRGGEGGVKSRLFDQQLALNVAGYYYNYYGLQVGAIEPARNGLATTRTFNAGAARSYGVDLDAAYRPHAITGLNIRAAANWNHARYLVLNNIPCYSGQTIAAGCNTLPDANPTHVDPATGQRLFTAQNLAGTPLVRAPQWQLSGGFDYEVPLRNDLTVVFTNNLTYSSKFVRFLAVSRPNNDQYQPAFAKVDLGVSLRGQDRWELSLIGKNITDKVIGANCNASTSSTGVLLGSAISGGTSPGRFGVSEEACNAEQGRELVVRASVRL